jgi:hypothetical protein
MPIITGGSAVVALVHNDCMADFLKSFVEKKERVDPSVRRFIDAFWAEQAIKAKEVRKNFGFSEVTLV